MLERRVYQRADILIEDTDRSLFMISKGTASVKVSLAGQAREKRLASFSPGAVFGEVALLDEEPRSATVTADEELVCYLPDADRSLRASQVGPPATDEQRTIEQAPGRTAREMRPARRHSGHNRQPSR